MPMGRSLFNIDFILNETAINLVNEETLISRELKSDLDILLFIPNLHVCFLQHINVSEVETPNVLCHNIMQEV